jgi:hypothetical protein
MRSRHRIFLVLHHEWRDRNGDHTELWRADGACPSAATAEPTWELRSVAEAQAGLGTAIAIKACDRPPGRPPSV